MRRIPAKPCRVRSNTFPNPNMHGSRIFVRELCNLDIEYRIDAARILVYLTSQYCISEDSHHLSHTGNIHIATSLPAIYIIDLKNWRMLGAVRLEFMNTACEQPLTAEHMSSCMSIESLANCNDLSHKDHRCDAATISPMGSNVISVCV